MILFIWFLFLALGLAIGYYFGYDHGFERAINDDSNAKNINTFEECANAGYPIAESYPRQCRTPEGRLFVEELTVDDGAVFCIQDAKLCDDGYYVGRVPPACEFAPCPGE